MLYFFAHEVLDECSTFKFKFTKWRRRSFQWNEFSLSSSMTCIKFLKLKPLKIVSVSTSCPVYPQSSFLPGTPETAGVRALVPCVLPGPGLVFTLLLLDLSAMFDTSEPSPLRGRCLSASAPFSSPCVCLLCRLLPCRP